MPRDDFSEPVKKAVALRASHQCSFDGCGQRTVGPSAESDTAITNVGEAAHITAASPGPGARRYDATLTPEQRADISNAMWLCSTHATLIDRDETTYTADRLREMKRLHEDRMAQVVKGGGTGHDNNQGDLIALGPTMVAVGSLVSGGDSRWEFRFSEFIDGDLEALVAFCDSFTALPASDRYILVNELADGRTLSGAPTWQRDGSGFFVTCLIAPRFSRVRAQDLGQDFKLGPDHDLTPTMEMVSGVEAFRQSVMTCLSTRKGEWFLDRSIGSRLAEYHSLFWGSPWFDRLLRLEVIRLAAIPRLDSVMRTEYLPLQCVEKVRSFSFLGDPKLDEWNKVRVDFEVNGLGSWVEDLEIYLAPAKPDAHFDPEQIAATMMAQLVADLPRRLR